MTKPLITLPCTAQELENALHAVCDHDGLWDGKVHVAYSLNDRFPHRLKLKIETETKGESK